MSFWSRIGFNAGVVTANANGPADIDYGDPDGIEIEPSPVSENRSLPSLNPSPWSGLPSSWQTPAFQAAVGINKLVDVAWACLDLNSNVAAAMPVYQTRDNRIIPPETWMRNPDETIYTSWQEFFKQLFWDYQMGEAFVLPMAMSGGYPSRFRVIPPFMMNVEMERGRRIYKLGSLDVTDDILHIRYKSTVDVPRGMGPLDSAGTRQTAIALLQRYANTLAETGGVPLYWLGVERRLTKTEGQDLIEQWVEGRAKNIGQPAILGSGATLNQSKVMSAHDMALTELVQMNESRIAVLLGVPPFLVGLAGAAAGASGSLCVDTETEILTRSGWKRYDQVLLGDETLTLNQETGASEWQPIQNVSTFDVVDRNMISMEMIGHSSFSTDDHQWPVMANGERVLRLTRDIRNQDALITAAPCADQPSEAKYSDALVEVAAWWYTEGNSVEANGLGRTAWLAQSVDANPDHCVRIRAAMTALFGPPAVTRNKTAAWSEYAYKQKNGKTICQWRLNRLASEVLWGITEDVGRKVLRRDFLYNLTPAQLEMFIQVSIWADGCEGSFTSFKQADDDRLQIFELACHLAGKTTQRHGSDVSVTVRKRQAIKPVAADGDARRAGREPLIRAFKWTGRVWCPTTPNQTWFARRNGTQFFTHNTYSNVTDLFDFHDRSSLRPKTKACMEALGQWALPLGRSVELNRDDYTRLPFDKRLAAYATAIEWGVLTAEEVRIMERYYGETAASSLSGGTATPGSPTGGIAAPALPRLAPNARPSGGMN